MDYYQLASDKVEVAKLTRDAGFYADSVYASCLAIEFYLKSVMNRVEDAQKYEFTHDVINLYKSISKQYKPKTDLLRIVQTCRKYNNESRYPYNGTEIFTIGFADQFIQYTIDVKRYIDEDCAASLENLKRKYNKQEDENTDF